MERTSKVLFYYLVVLVFLQIILISGKPLTLVPDLGAMLKTWKNEFQMDRDEAMADYQHAWLIEERAAWNNQILEEEKVILSFLQKFIARDLGRGLKRTPQAVEENGKEQLQRNWDKVQHIEHIKICSAILTQVLSHGKLLNRFPDLWNHLSDPSSSRDSLSLSSFKQDLEFSKILCNTTVDFLEQLLEIKSIVSGTLFGLSVAPLPLVPLNTKLKVKLLNFDNDLDWVNNRWEGERKKLTEDKEVATAAKLVQLTDDLKNQLVRIVQKLRGGQGPGSSSEKVDFHDSFFQYFGDHVLEILGVNNSTFPADQKDRRMASIISTILIQIQQKGDFNELKQRRSQILTFFNQSLVTLSDLLEHLEEDQKNKGISSSKISGLKLQLTLNLTQVTTFMKAGVRPLSVTRSVSGHLAGLVMMFDHVISMVSSNVNQGQDQIRLFEMTTKMFNFHTPASFSRFRPNSSNFTGKVTALSGKYEEILNITKMWAFPFDREFFEKIPEVFSVSGNFSDTAKDVAALAGLLVKNVKTINDRLVVVKGSLSSPYDSSCSGEFDRSPFARTTQSPDNLFLAPLFEGEAITVNFTIGSMHKFKDAIKFRRIGVNFRIEGDPELDKEFQEKVNRKLVYLTHSGRSTFRYKGQIFTMETEPMEFYFSMKNDRGEPRVWNFNYMTSRNGEMPLSPYALWEIQFDDRNLDEDDLINWVAEFGHLKKANISIELKGNGTFVLANEYRSH